MDYTLAGKTSCFCLS